MTSDTSTRRFLRSLRRSAVPLILSSVLFLASAAPPAAAGPIQFTLGFNASFLNSSYHTTGFEAGSFLPLWRKAGLHASVGFLEVRTHANYDLGDAWVADIGAWKGFGPDKYPSIVFGGVSLIISDAYDVDLIGGGVHLGFCQECWFGKHFGVYGRAVLRACFGGEVGHDLNEFAPSLSAGAVLRF
jgi:hypothetical protein